VKPRRKNIEPDSKERIFVNTEETKQIMSMKLEVVPLTVSDVDGSITFYRDKVGFILDHDMKPNKNMRVVQLTPNGSACSIVFGVGIQAADSVKGLHLVVEDISKVRNRLIINGVEVSNIEDMGAIKYAYFDDLDNNSWALQQIG
jgi:catechol 2,3-dioxygenase-like lactoylglutathione lyase family enzyme